MKTINIELLALDLDKCGRCGGTLVNLEEALAIATPALDALGISTEVSKNVVKTLEEAEKLRFMSSPTIRIDGADVMSTTPETSCDACSDLCGCEGGVDCRVWPWRGRTHEAAPVGLLVEVILRAAVNPSRAAATPAWQEVPENLKRFFEGKNAAGANEKQTCGGAACSRS